MKKLGIKFLVSYDRDFETFEEYITPKEFIKEMGIESDSSGIEWVAKEKLSVSSEITEKLQSLFADLEDHDDVEDYFTNAE